MAIKILVSRQLDGTTFSLPPEARDRVREVEAGNIPSQLYVGHDTRFEFEQVHGPIWQHVAQILTGLTEQQLKGLGGVSFVDPDDHVLHRLPEAA